MATVWARAEVEIDVDGDGIPRQLRVIATAAGKEAGQSAGKSFSKNFSKTLDKESNTWGRRLERRLKSMGNALTDTSKKFGLFNRQWRTLPHGFRQATFWVGLFTSAMTELAALSSAAGVGLLVLGSAIGSLVVGLGAVVSSSIRFLGDIDKVPKAVKPARKEFDKLLETLSDLNKAITIRAFQNTEKAWAKIGKVIKGLTPDFEKIGDVINGLIFDLSEGLDRNSGNLSTFISNSADVFGRLARAVGRFSEALLTAFTNPKMVAAVSGFAGWIDDIVNGFSDFVNGPNFDDWIGNGVAIFEALGSLLEGALGVLNDLVDQQAIDDLLGFFDSLEGFITGGGAGILEFFKELNIFGLIAEALDDIGKALEPLQGPMEDLATALNDVIDVAIDQFADNIEAVAEAIAPFVQSIADFMAENPQAVADGLVAIAAGFAALNGINGIAAATTALGGFVGSIEKLSSPQNKERYKAAGKLAGAAIVAGLVAGLVEGLFGGGGTEGESNVLGAVITGAMLGSIAGLPGVVVGAFAGVIANMIHDVFFTPDVKTAWEEGWDQIFDPNNFEGAGIGEFKKWMQTDLKQWGEDNLAPLAEGWQESVDIFWSFFADKIDEGLSNASSNFNTWGQQFSEGWNTLTSNIRIAWALFTGWFELQWTNLTNGWNSFWGGLGTAVKVAWALVVATVKTNVNTVIDWINSMIEKINGALQQINNLTFGLTNFRIPTIPGLASGGVLLGPTRILAGEAGPEAVVPLRRNLSQVDPSVRALSAIAQGLGTPAMGRGGVVTNSGRTINVAEGAVKVEGVRDPFLASKLVVDRITELAVV